MLTAASRLRRLVWPPKRSAAAAQASTRRSVGTAPGNGVTPELLDTLRRGIQHEARHSFCNTQGTTASFDAFLQQQVRVLAAAGKVEQGLLQQAMKYRSMPHDERQQLCSYLQECVGHLLGAEAAAGAKAQARSVAPAYGARARLARTPPVRQQQQQQRPQREQQLLAKSREQQAISVAVQQQEPAKPSGQEPQQAPQQQEPALPLQAPPGGQQGRQLHQEAPRDPSSEGCSTLREAQQSNPIDKPLARLAEPAWSPPPAPGTGQGPKEPAFTGSAAAREPGNLAQEWGLTLAQQKQQPFQPPDPSGLRRPVPVVFDLETTGFTRDACIVEIGAVAALSGEPFQRYVRLPAGVEVPGEVQAVTGLSTELVNEQGEPFQEAYTAFRAFLQRQVEAAGADAYLLLVGHNVKTFDLPRLHRAAIKYGLPALRAARVLDSYHLAAAVFPSPLGGPGQPPSLKLGALFQHFTGAAPAVSHRAQQDCDSNLLVLQRLVELLPVDGLAGGSFEAKLHAAAWHPAARWGGWAANGVPSKPAARPRVTRSPVRPGGATPSLVDTLASSVAADAQEAERVPDLADPLVEAEAWGEGAALAAADRRCQVEALREGWRAVQQEPQLRASFLTTPLTHLKRRGGFTEGQIRKLEAAGVATLGQLLDCFPSRLITSLPGRLPQEGDTDPVVTLAARTAKKPFLGSTRGGAYLRAEYEVVHPREAGLQAPWLPPDTYDEQRCRLQVYEFRVGSRAMWALQQLQRQLQGAGEVAVLTGPVRPNRDPRFGGPDAWQLESNKWSVLGLEEARAAFLQPFSCQLQVVHPTRADLQPRQLAAAVAKALEEAEGAQADGRLQDPLPSWLREQYGLLGLLPALRGVHSPSGEAELDAARARLAFQELLALQLKLLLQRNMAWAEVGGGAASVRPGSLLELAVEALPFELTQGQQSALDSILAQMEGWPPMQCLLQGDVGCGKTVVAFLALLAAVGSGYQGAIMAPTEILAEQHHRGLAALVQDINRAAGRRQDEGFKLPRIALVTGSVRGRARAQVDQSLAAGEVDIAVGTHALISDSTRFARLGLAVVDEQHKFGVEQRGRLLAKALPAPHVLHMTATPIPRTQALCDHGSMAQVVIADLPAGRSQVVTRMLQDSGPQREQMYAHIREEMARGHGIYIVCPFVETSDKMEEVKAATSELERLVQEGVFEAQDCGLLHGQMPPEEKDAVLRRFKCGDIQVLVSTTVVEVGVDVPQATVMVVEHAERFGFAQLHQLRGRVGRSPRQSFCYLVYPPEAGPAVKKKMKVLVNCSNGFAVAECDLELRGAGDVMGKKQSGRDIKTSFKVAQLPADRLLLEQARQAASQLLAREPDPRRWPAELRALVADEGMLQLDTHTLPSQP